MLKSAAKGVCFMYRVKFSIFHNQSYIDLGLYQFGMETCRAGHSFGPARRNHYLFHYVLSGRGTLFAENSDGETETWRVNAGEGFMIFPEQVNTYVADMRNPWAYTWLEFDGLRVDQALASAGLSQDMPLYRTKSRELTDKMKDEMLFIVDNDKAEAFQLIGHLYLFMDYLMRSAQDARLITVSKLRDFYIREAVTYIENNYMKDISVGDIADTLRLDHSYFGKIFRLATGKSPQSFLIHYRLTKAAELLVMTRRQVGDICESVGYQNQMHFSRAFKKMYGVSPREWRSGHHMTEDSSRQ